MASAMRRRQSMYQTRVPALFRCVRTLVQTRNRSNAATGPNCSNCGLRHQSLTREIEMRNHRLVALLSAAAITIASSLAVASPAHAEDAIVKLVSVESGKCLQPITGPSPKARRSFRRPATAASLSNGRSQRSPPPRSTWSTGQAVSALTPAAGPPTELPSSSGRATGSATRTGASASPTTCCRRESPTPSATASLHQDCRTAWRRSCGSATETPRSSGTVPTDQIASVATLRSG
jgi:hypothetical protein